MSDLTIVPSALSKRALLASFPPADKFELVWVSDVVSGRPQLKHIQDTADDDIWLVNGAGRPFYATADVERVKVRTPSGAQALRLVSDIREGEQFVLSRKGQLQYLRQGQRTFDSAMEIITTNDDDLFEIANAHLEANANSSLLDVIATAPGSARVLDEALLRLAEEVEALGVERTYAVRKGTGKVAITSGRRATVLDTMTRVYKMRRDLVSMDGLDVEGLAFKVALRLIIETFRDVLVDTNIRPEQMSIIMNTLAKRMDDGWKSTLQKRLKEQQAEDGVE